MIKKAAIMAMLTGLAITLFSFITDISGHWTGKVNDQFEVAFDFKQDGETLTGSTKGPDGNEIKLSDGTIKGDDIAFNMPMMGDVAKVTGKVKGDVITLTFKGPQGDMSFDLTKAK
jgi:hypothetical protein